MIFLWSEVNWLFSVMIFLMLVIESCIPSTKVYRYNVVICVLPVVSDIIVFLSIVVHSVVFFSCCKGRVIYKPMTVFTRPL